MPPDEATDYQPAHSSAQAAAAAGISTDTLKNWVSRQPQVVLLLNDEREQIGKGHPILFSFNRVMQIALTAEMVRLGLQPRPAAMAAATFTDLGDENRAPGQLYAAGSTVLAVLPNHGEATLAAYCLNPPIPTGPFEFPGEAIMAHGVPSAWVSINVNAVFARVRARLAEQR